MTRSFFAAFALIACVLAAAAPARAQDRINLVATNSILADIARNVGGDRVNVTSLVSANGDSHVYTPAPSDAKRIADSRLVIINGLGLEGWLPRLVKSAGGKADIVTATTGITPRKQDGHADPHAWQAVPNAGIYAGNIRDALIAADPASAATYRANTDAYQAKLDQLDKEIREAVAGIPQARRKVISTHDAFGYFADAYGITFVAPRGVSTEAEPSARDVAAIITQVRKAGIPAVFLENISDPRLMKRIAGETGAKIGGTLYSDSLTDEKGDAPTYIDMVRHNIKTLTSALTN